jgi:hypothetical protein
MFYLIFLPGHKILGTELRAGLCRRDCNKFYNLLRHKNTNAKNAPSTEEIQNFWKEIFGKKGSTQ